MDWLRKIRGLRSDKPPGPLEKTSPVTTSAIALPAGEVMELIERGYQAKDSGRLKEALALFHSAHIKDRNSDAAVTGLGLVYKDLNQPEDALRQFNQVLARKPDHVASLCNAAASLSMLGRTEEAIAFCHRALEVDTSFEPALTMLAQCLNASGRHQDALVICNQLVEAYPHHIRLRRNRALTLHQLGRFDLALDDFRTIVALEPSDQQARYSLGLNALLCGDFATGWSFHEARFAIGAAGGHPLAGRIDQAAWDGKRSLNDKTMLLYAEQGYGDTIQFSRYCQMVKARGAHVLLGVPAALRPLFRNLEGVDELIPDGRELPHFDEHCALMSLPLAFDTRLDTIPEIGAVLAASPDKQMLWRHRLGEKQRLRAAVSWKGNPRHTDDAKRSLSLAEFSTLFSLPMDFLVIQFGITEAERAILATRNNVRDVTAEVVDFEDSAALFEQCDLVISIDSAPAHLAGAMAKPCCILIAQPPEWRWLLEREDSPWYQSVRLFRQPRPGDWQGALARLTLHLSALIEGSDS
jgi:tetratricopeptide (TPR) repeat protein